MRNELIKRNDVGKVTKNDKKFSLKVFKKSLIKVI